MAHQETAEEEIKRLHEDGFMSKIHMSMISCGNDFAVKAKQFEIFYCIFTAYVKQKIAINDLLLGFDGEDLEEMYWTAWLERGAVIVTRDWLTIINVYAAMLKCCGVSMQMYIDPVLQGDDAKHYLNYAYNRFLAPKAIPNELYISCVSVIETLVQDVSTNPIFNIEEGSSVAKLVSKFEKVL
jgi:hypothetical protein